MPKFLRKLLAFLGLVEKYRPVVVEAVKDAKPLVKDLLKK